MLIRNVKATFDFSNAPFLLEKPRSLNYFLKWKQNYGCKIPPKIILKNVQNNDM